MITAQHALVLNFKKIIKLFVIISYSTCVLNTITNPKRTRYINHLHAHNATLWSPIPSAISFLSLDLFPLNLNLVSSTFWDRTFSTSVKKGTTWRLYVRLYRRINTSNTYFSVKSPVITLTTSVFLFSLNCCCFDVVLILDSVCAFDREYKFSLPDYRYLNLHCDAEWPKLPPLALPVKLTIHPSRFLVALSSSAR